MDEDTYFGRAVIVPMLMNLKQDFTEGKLLRARDMMNRIEQLCIRHERDKRREAKKHTSVD